jgi:hypothetical protein
MRPVLRYLTVIACSLASPTLPCAEAPASGTLIAYLARVQSTSVEPVIEYCVKQAPGLAEQLKVEFLALKQRLNEASARLVERVPRERLRSLSAEEQRQLESLATQFGAAQLEDARQNDPAEYCPMVINRLRTLSVESLLAQIDMGYNQYVEAEARKKLQLGAQ